MNLKNELADKLKKEAEHFSGAKDLVEMLLDAEAMIRNLHTENTALRVTEDNLRQELQECQDQRRAAFRRIEELDAMREQIGQGEPDGLLESQIEPRPLLYPLSDYHRAMTDGPLHYTWIDKPHRLVYDLIAAVRYYAFARAIEAAHNIGEKK